MELDLAGMSKPPPLSPRYIPALDGLRAVALMLVMLDHWSAIFAGPWSALPKAQRLIFGIADAGWCGVDLFFVLSGFLITGILLDTRAKPQFFKNFYVRRTLRIFPPYYFFLAVWLLWRPSFVSPAQHAALVSHQGWYWVYLQNWHVSFAGWPGGGIDHLWSLAIEEQFYLVWPLVVLIAGLAGTLRIALVVMALSPLVRVAALMAIPHAPIMLYASTLTRLDPLAAGAALAAMMRTPTLRHKLHSAAPWLTALGGLALTTLVAIDREWTKFDSGTQIFGFAFLALLFVGVVAMLTTRDNAMTRFFAMRPLRAIGKISYTGYIVHLPVFVAVAHVLSPQSFAAKLACLPLGALLSFAAALISWHVLEKPLLALKNRWAPPPREALR